MYVFVYNILPEFRPNPPTNVRIIIQNINEHVNKSELRDSHCNLYKLDCDIYLIFLGITWTFFQDKVAW